MPLHISESSQLRDECGSLKLILDSGLGGIYLEILSEGIGSVFQDEFQENSEYDTALFTGALFYVSVKWIQNGCRESVKAVSDSFCMNMFRKN